MIKILFVLFALVSSAGAAGRDSDTKQAAGADEIFRYAIPTKPHTLDPSETAGFDSQHLLGAMFRGLYKVSENGEILKEGAESCKWLGTLKLKCKIKSQKYSDGSAVTADDYVRAFRHFLRKESKTPEIELLLNIKNAMEFHNGNTESLGISSSAPNALIFEFSRPDPEFEYKLASPLLFPWKVKPEIANINSIPVNGPYKVTSWEKSKITLSPNENYIGGHPRRPKLEVRFIPDENTLINLFDSGRLNFIRRLPTLSIERYRKHRGFIARPLSRFDYLGFGPGLKKFEKLRQAMTESLDYDEFRRLFDSLSRPGCPSFPDSFADRRRCYDFKAKKYLLELPARPLRFLINQTGGEDLRRSAEWFQNQWKKSLELAVEIQSIEGRVLLSEIKNNTPDIFRLSVPLTRPTCLAALELFKTASENNRVNIQDQELDRLIVKLESSKSEAQKKKNCGLALDRLLQLRALIPLGRFQFFMVVSEGFEGLIVNELNQLDLSQLHAISLSK